MAMLGSPVANSDTKWYALPDDMYEAVVFSVEEVPNKWYNPETDRDTKKTQLEWVIVVRPSEVPAFDDGDTIVEDGVTKEKKYGTKLKYWTGAAIGRHPKNKLTGACRAIDKGFDIEKGYAGWDDFLSKVKDMPVRIITRQGDPNDKGDVYASIQGLLPSKSPLGMEELLLMQGATNVYDQGDNPL